MSSYTILQAARQTVEKQEILFIATADKETITTNYRYNIFVKGSHNDILDAIEYDKPKEYHILAETFFHTFAHVSLEDIEHFSDAYPHYLVKVNVQPKNTTYFILIGAES